MLDSPSAQDRSLVGSPFSVAVHPDRSRVVVVPSGEVDLATVGTIERELADLRLAGFDDIVVDLRQVTFLDSSGLRLLLTHARAAQDDGYRFALVEGPPAVHRLFELTGTTTAFDFTDTPRR